MRYLFAIVLFIVVVCPINSASAQNQSSSGSLLTGTRALELPDISIVGDITTYFTSLEDQEEDNHIRVREVELAIGGFLYPGIRADVYGALHYHEGAYETELEEAYVNFLQTPIRGLSFKVGKQYLNIGKINSLHPHSWNYVTRPLVQSAFLGDHGLAATGITAALLIPVPFFLQVELGAWHTDAAHEHEAESEEGDHEEGEEEEHHHEFGLAGETYSGRLWSSFPIAASSELEIGASAVTSHGPHHEEEKDDVTLTSMDLTWRSVLSAYRKLTIQGEWYRLDRSMDEGDFQRTGGFVFAGFRFDRRWDIGARYDWTEMPVDDLEEQSRASLILTHSLSEMTRIRAQYDYDIENEEHEGFIQILFGIGPHTHALQ